MKRIFIYLIAVFSLTSLFCTCGKEEDNTGVAEIEVQGIRLSQETLVLAVGEQYSLGVTVIPENATDKTVKWICDNEAVATVSAQGVITAMSEGTAVVTAIAGSKRATCSVLVRNGSIAVESVSLSETSLTLVKGATDTLRATIIPDNATDKTVMWTSSNDMIVSVSTEGVVKALQEGTAVITASAGGKSAQCTVTVSDNVVEVEKIILSQSILTLDEGETATLTATVLPADATDKTVSWSSSNPSVASVSSGGVVTAVGEGKATITASAGGKRAECAVTVSRKVVNVTQVVLSQTSLSLLEGETATLTATVLPADATDKTVSWSSSNPSVASVSSNGVVTAKSAGQATITASAGGKHAECAVTVSRNVVNVTQVVLSQTSLSLLEGETATLTATVLPTDATDKTVSWSSSNPSVASVSSGGVVTAKSAGTATVTASAGGKHAECIVTVKSEMDGGMNADINPWDEDDTDYGGKVN